MDVNWQRNSVLPAMTMHGCTSPGSAALRRELRPIVRGCSRCESVERPEAKAGDSRGWPGVWVSAGCFQDASGRCMGRPRRAARVDEGSKRGRADRIAGIRASALVVEFVRGYIADDVFCIGQPGGRQQGMCDWKNVGLWIVDGPNVGACCVDHNG